MTAPAWCPNFGVDCDFPNCTLLEAECATAEASAVARNQETLENKQQEPEQVVRVVPPTKPGELPTLFPITADEIFGK